MSTKQNEIIAIPNKNELSKYIKPVYILDTYMQSESDYKKFESSLYTIMKGCFEHEECRHYPIKFRFYLVDKETYTLPFNLFIANMFLLYPFVHLYGIHSILNDSYLIKTPEGIPRVKDYINNKIIKTMHEYGIKNTIINRSISEVLYNLRTISIDFSDIMNISFSTETFLQLYEKNPRIREIMNTEFPQDMQPSDVEEKLNSLQREEIEIYKAEPNNIIGHILRSGTGIKDKQFAEFTIATGLKPDLNGVTIPLVTSTSTLLKGMNKVSSHFIESGGARYSLIQNKNVMGKAGYFGKVVTLLSMTLSLSDTVSDCNTKHLLPIDITSKKMLKKYNGRYYKLDNKGETLLLNSDDDNHLIGKTVYFRSPITCTCGDSVCHKCFGTTSLLNIDIKRGVVGFEVEEVTKVVNQMILSTKHLLTTVSEKIEFNDEFYKFFDISMGEINPILDNDAIEDLDDWAIWIDPNDLRKSDELDNDSSFNTYVNGKFYIQNMVTKDYIEIKCKDDKELYLTEESLSLCKKGKGYIKFKDMDETSTLFVLEIMNNELTRPLYELIDLLNRERKKDDEVLTYSQMAQRFTELLLESRIDAMALSGELIINRLIRKVPDDDFERPDFSKKDIGEYQIYRILKALAKNKSGLIGLSSQDVKRQLLSDELVDKKDGTSYIDNLFKIKTSTKRLKELNKLMEKNKL